MRRLFRFNGQDPSPSASKNAVPAFPNLFRRRSLTRRGPSSPDHPRSVLDHIAFPHIFDAIVDEAVNQRVLVMRATRRAVRDRMDKHMFEHVALFIFTYDCTELRSTAPPYHRLPVRWDEFLNNRLSRKELAPIKALVRLRKRERRTTWAEIGSGLGYTVALDIVPHINSPTKHDWRSPQEPEIPYLPNLKVTRTRGSHTPLLLYRDAYCRGDDTTRVTVARFYEPLAGGTALHGFPRIGNPRCVLHMPPSNSFSFPFHEPACRVIKDVTFVLHPNGDIFDEFTLYSLTGLMLSDATSQLFELSHNRRSQDELEPCGDMTIRLAGEAIADPDAMRTWFNEMCTDRATAAEAGPFTSWLKPRWELIVMSRQEWEASVNRFEYLPFNDYGPAFPHLGYHP